MHQYIYNIDDITILANYINKLNMHFIELFTGTDDIKDFSICTAKEQQIIIHIIYHISYHKPNIPRDIIFIAAIYYYYYSIILEYYVVISYPSFLFSAKRKIGHSIQKINKLLIEISSSSDNWACHVRRIVYFTDDV